MKILITGSRDWNDVETILNRLSKLPPGSTIIHGACRGADMIAHAVAEQLGFIVRAFPADWDRYGLRAGRIRNRQMLDDEHMPHHNDPVDIVLAFHDWLELSKGTKHMVDIAKRCNINVEIITSNNVLASQ